MTKNVFFRFLKKSLILYCIRSKNVMGVFHDLKNVKIAKRSWKTCNFWPIFCQFYLHFMNLNHILKKVGRRGATKTDLFV
jgi:hypothetical protein